MIRKPLQIEKNSKLLQHKLYRFRLHRNNKIESTVNSQQSTIIPVQPELILSVLSEISRMMATDALQALRHRSKSRHLTKAISSEAKP